MSNQNTTTIGKYSHLSNVELRDNIESQMIILGDLIDGLHSEIQHKSVNSSGTGLYYVFIDLKAMLDELDNRFKQLEGKRNHCNYKEAVNLIDQAHRLFFPESYNENS